MSEADKAREAFEEACWRAWVEGINPDNVSRERIVATIESYAEPHECASAELNRILSDRENAMREVDRD